MNEINVITPEMLSELREKVKGTQSERRFFHTLGVEREIISLSELYCPEKKELLQAAALLHDITKEYSTECQLEIMGKYSISREKYENQSPKIYHSLTAALIIPAQYPEFSNAELVHAVCVHTTGERGMSLSDKLLYLADYIEDTRTFEDCIRLREYFYSGIERGEDKIKHLDKTLLLSFDMTLRDLIERNKTKLKDTIDA